MFYIFNTTINNFQTPGGSTTPPLKSAHTQSIRAHNLATAGSLSIPASASPVASKVNLRVPAKELATLKAPGSNKSVREESSLAGTKDKEDPYGNGTVASQEKAKQPAEPGKEAAHKRTKEPSLKEDKKEGKKPERMTSEETKETVKDTMLRLPLTPQPSDAPGSGR
jgi:hypothetical protein